jgi:predicted amidohydrolase
MTAQLCISVAAVGIRRYTAFEEFERHIEPLVAEASAAGSDLIVLPELLCVGLLWTDGKAGTTDTSTVKALYWRALTPLFPRYQGALSDLARRHRIAIAGASYWHQRDGKAVNTALWCQTDGTVNHQDKLHPTKPEQAIDTVGGDELRLFELNGIKVGLLVCYDIQFPELSRKLVDGGAELIVVPSLTDSRGYWRVRHCAQARAIENQIFTCVAPLIGNLGIPVDRSPERHGRPFVACPIDNRFRVEDGILIEGPMDVEGVVHSRLDVDALRLSRSKSEITQLNDRRPDLYARRLIET